MSLINPLQDRIRGMIWGQFIGDAATLGTHWIYDEKEMAHAYPEGVHGFEAPRPGHYHERKQPGDQTHYGDAALLLLESVAGNGGFVIEDFARRFAAFFNDPVCAVYKDHSTRETLAHLAVDPENLANGADDDQPATVTRLAALLAWKDADPASIEELTRFSQNNDRAVAYAFAHTEILAALLDGESLEAAADAVTGVEPAKKVREARAALGYSVMEATLGFGQSCPLAKTFPGALHAALKFPEDFRSAIVETTRAGGDNAGRAAMVGAWLGAHLGMVGIPGEWRNRLTHGARIEAAIVRLLQDES